MRRRRRNRFPGNGPYRDIHPYHRPGHLYGGRGRGFRGDDPTKCARFPWLKRRWWANPDEDDPTAPPVLPGSEKELLEAQLGYLNKELEQIKIRLEELGETENQ